jgi:hypothetical protein
MARLTKIQKLELLALSRSGKLRKDFEMMRKNQALLIKRNLKNSPGLYLEFLKFASNFCNVKRKPFEKMEGRQFKL